MIKRLFYPILIAVISTAAFVACSSEIMTLPMDVSLDQSALTLSPGESLTLSADVIPDESIDKTLVWSSSNTDVATVNDGVVTAIAEGETTISVSVTTLLGVKKKSCQVTVAYPVRSVAIDKNVGLLSVGENLTLTAVVMPNDAPDKSVTWDSSDPKVAVVADGVVTAKNAGTAIITVATTVGKRIATCYIKVFAGKYIGMTLQDAQSATISLSGSGKAVIDWGDGSASETRTLFPAKIDSISYNYSSVPSGVITIEGEGITYLDCSGNRLTGLAVDKNTALTNLNCANNRLINLDVSKNTALTDLNCSNNPLMNIDVSGNAALTTLYCISNQLTKLDVGNNAALKNLNCSYNQLTNLDVSRNAALILLECTRNQLTALDISKNSALKNLNCSDNQITNLDVSKNTALTDFACDNNELNSLNVSNTKLTAFSIINSTNLNLVVSNNDALVSLNCPDSQLTGLVVSDNAVLNDLDCSNNQLKSLDISTDTQLANLYCFGNQLNSLDVSNLPWLTILDCSDNPIKKLDLSSNGSLKRLHCEKNQLKVLDVSHNRALTHVNCQINQMTSLDMSNNTHLLFLQCQTNQLSADALRTLFGTFNDNDIYTNKPVCIYGNPGANGISYADLDALNYRTKWIIYLPDVNSSMKDPWDTSFAGG